MNKTGNLELYCQNALLNIIFFLYFCVCNRYIVESLAHTMFILNDGPFIKNTEFSSATWILTDEKWNGTYLVFAVDINLARF